jgi:hypothetical protein
VWFKDSLLVIEKYKSGFLPPADHPFEDLSTTDGSTSNISQTGLGVRDHAMLYLICVSFKETVARDAYFSVSGINHFGSGSGQPLSGMNLKLNLKFTISQPNAQLKYHTILIE